MFLDVQDARTAIMVGAQNGHKDVVDLLISNGADINQQEKVRLFSDVVTCNLYYCG